MTSKRSRFAWTVAVALALAGSVPISFRGTIKLLVKKGPAWQLAQPFSLKTW